MGRTPDFPKHNTIPDLISDIRRPKVGADTAWYRIGLTEDYEIPFEGSWANSGGTDEADAGWYQDGEGETKFEGVVLGGGEGSTIFTMPEENRPRTVKTFTCAVIGGGSANVAVYPDGSVVLESYN